MKRALGVLLAVVVATLGVAQSSYAVAANDFTFVSLHADYYLGADKDGRSTLKTVETLVVNIPASKQGQQIDQTIPKNDDGHPTDLKFVSVTDQNKKAKQFWGTSSGSNEILHITVPNKTSGQQTYVVTYTQRDVTTYVANPGEHEFAWQVGSAQWRQAIPTVSATIYASSNIEPTLNKRVTCTVGSTSCQITEKGNTITASAKNVGAGQSMAIMVGFTAGTFRAYEPTLGDHLATSWPIIAIVIVCVIIIIVVGVVYYRKKQKGER